MDYKNLFEKFNEGGKLLLPDTAVDLVLKLQLMRCKPHFCLKTSDKIVFTDKCVLFHFFNTNFALWI